MSEETFDSFGLDTRLLQALKRLNYDTPSPIQAKAIPLALDERKNIVARAKTGSGKTAAYLIPIIQQQLGSPGAKNAQAIILVPSKELAEQVSRTVTTQLAVYCSLEITCVNCSLPVSDEVQSALLQESPRIVVGTPSKIVAQIQNGLIDAKNVRFLVVDEADLVASYGYEDDLNELSSILDTNRNEEDALQVWLMSATLGSDVDDLREKFCARAGKGQTAILKLSEEEEGQDKLRQFFVFVSEIDKFLLAYVIFKLHLIQGKTLIFVNDIDRGYRLKLFLEQFGIKAAVLNSELPLMSRLHIVEQFNRSIFEILIATDEKIPDKPELASDSSNSTSNKTKKSSKKDKEFTVSRGMDFQNVSWVLNFDLPASSRAYTHRVGRTARANKSGAALSFVVRKKDFGKHKTAMFPSARKDEKTMVRIERAQEKLGRKIEPYNFNKSQVESFRYRMEDAFRAVTKVAIREARIKEIKQELLTSEKLQRHFEENPDDLNALKHDRELHTVRSNPELKRIPEYLLPKSSRRSVAPIAVVDYDKRKKYRGKKGIHKRKNNPLKSFKR